MVLGVKTMTTENKLLLNFFCYKKNKTKSSVFNKNLYEKDEKLFKYKFVFNFRVINTNIYHS